MIPPSFLRLGKHVTHFLSTIKLFFKFNIFARLNRQKQASLRHLVQFQAHVPAD